MDSLTILRCWDFDIYTIDIEYGSGSCVGEEDRQFICFFYRIFWAFLLSFFLGLTFYQVHLSICIYLNIYYLSQVSERIGYYFIRNPLITTRTYDTPTMLPFPTVVVCNKMQLK